MTLRKLLGSMNMAETRTAQDYKRSKNSSEWKDTYIYSVKAKSQAGNIWVKHIMTIQKDQTERKPARNLRDLS